MIWTAGGSSRPRDGRWPGRAFRGGTRPSYPLPIRKVHLLSSRAFPVESPSIARKIPAKHFGFTHIGTAQNQRVCQPQTRKLPRSVRPRPARSAPALPEGTPVSKKAPRSDGKRRAGGRRNGRRPARSQALSHPFQSRHQRRGQRRSMHPPFRAAVRRRAAARSARPVSSPSAARAGSLAPAGHRGRAAGRARQRCVCGSADGVGYPERSVGQRSAPARSGGSDSPPVRPSGSRAGSPPARLARRPAEPVNRRSSVGGPTKSDPPARPEVQASGPLRAFLPAVARGRAFHGRGPGEDMEAFALKRAPDPSSGPFPALCAAEGPLGRSRPRILQPDANTARQAGRRRLEGAGGYEAAPAGYCQPGKTIRQAGSFRSPHRLLSAQIPPESRSNRGKTSSVLHPGNAPAGRGAALHRRLNAG